jgi:hypothetical protein
MEDLAMDRIYRLMIAQRYIHRDEVKLAGADGNPVALASARAGQQAFRRAT